MDVNIALVGNPNVGKTTVYNRLTDSFEHVGNWHGVTVAAKSKVIAYEGRRLNIIDLPGIYSLTPYSGEECISRDAVMEGCDVIVNVCDAGNLARNLCLTLQLIECGANVILAVNMTEELSGVTIDYAGLSRALGIRVLPLSLKFGNELLDAALAAVKSPVKPICRHLSNLPVNDIVSVIRDEAARAGLRPEYAAVKLLEGDGYIIQKLDLSKDKLRRVERYTRSAAAVASARYAYIDKILSEVTGGKRAAPLRGVDKLLLNKYLALPMFALIVFAVFLVIFAEFEIGGKTVGLIGYWLKYAISAFLENCVRLPVSNALTGADAAPWAVGLVTDGIIGSISSVLIFLPQIVLLFFFLALLEDSGYISRVAFMTDGLFQKIGLSGRSVFTMLMGLGCSATAVLTARGLDDEMTRKKTVLLTPFMSCSAKLPVYLAISSAYFAAGQIFVILGMYLLGGAVSVTYAAIAQKFKRFKSGNPGFIMELPPYRFPSGTRIFQLLWHNTKMFLLRVGTAVFLLGAAVWLLSHFTFGFSYTGDSMQGSMLSIVADVIAIIFAPLGFGNGKAATALISGLIAKESVISTIDALGGVSAVFTGRYAGASAFAFLVFTLLYIPCIATLTATAKETGVKWMLLGAAVQMFTAYVLSMISYYIAVMFISHTGIGVTVTVVAIVGAAAALAIRRLIKNRSDPCGCCAIKPRCRGGCKDKK